MLQRNKSVLQTQYGIEMDELDEIRLRMHISKLEARLALREIESETLAREIKSSLTSFESKEISRRRLRRVEDESHQIRDIAAAHASAPLKELQRHFGFEPDRVAKIAKDALGKRHCRASPSKRGPLVTPLSSHPPSPSPFS